jgi:DNA polymerase-3 subunit delta'
VSHAYIFTGEDTAAVKSHAQSFAKGLNCERADYGSAGGEPCGTCISCRVFDSGNHPDTIYVVGTLPSGGIGVDDVRNQIVKPMATKPFKYKYKVFIVEHADTFHRDEPQNALLKTIEEPAPYGVFLFLASNTYCFLPTVLSRCVVKKIRGESDFSDNPALSALAEEVFAALSAADIPAAFALYRKVEPLGKQELQQFLNLLYVLYGKNINAVAKSGQVPPQNWLNATSAITQTKKFLSQNANTQLAIELMMLKLRGVE